MIGAVGQVPRGPIPERERRWSLAASVSSVFTALLASACCVGPLVLALLGIGGAGLLVKFEPYRPYFTAATVALLAAGFYLNYRKPRTARGAAPASPEVECDCPAPRTNRVGRVMLWVATVLVAGFLAFPYLVAYVLE